jgi:hypothetical protein
MAKKQPDAPAWREEWRRKFAWTAQQLAHLCCGWDPGDHHLPNPAKYNRILQEIQFAVNYKDEGLMPAVRIGLWEADDPDRKAQWFYGSIPVFTPSRVVAWAASHYPEFPYTTKDFQEFSDDREGVQKDELPVRMRQLLTVVRGLTGVALQKEVQAVIREAMGVDNRTAQAYAALVRPDGSVGDDARAARRR